jgi:hypothetical protein
MKIISSVLISSVLLLTSCSSVSEEQCDYAMDEIFYLYQTDQDSGEYFESVRAFLRDNC